MRAKMAGMMLFCFIVFQHFTLVSLASYELTLGTVAGIAFLALVIVRTSYVATTATWCVLAILSGVAVLSSGYSAGGSYTTTALLFLLSSAIICSALGVIREKTILSFEVSNAAFAALVVVVGLSVLQVAAARFGNASFFNVFGARQYFHEYNHLVGLVDFPRAQGFYLEPSYNAFVIGSVGVFLLTLKHRRRLTLVLVVAGIAASQSATALILLLVFLLIAVLKASVRIRLLAVVASVVVVLFSGAYLLLRLGTVTTEGTSAYYRVLAPVEVMIDVLTFSPLGRPFGSVEETLEGYNLFMAGVPATSLDNGFYVVVFYFGWFGLLAILAFAVFVVGATFRKGKGDRESWIPWVWILGVYAFSGAIMTPEFGLTIALLLIAIRSRRSAAVSASEEWTSPVRRDGDVSGPGGAGENARLASRASRDIRIRR